MTAEKVEGAKYVVATDDYAGHYTGKYVKQGDVVTLTKDDGTAAPLFRVPNGEEVFLRMKDLVKLNIDGDEPVKKTVKTLTQDEFDSIEVGDKVTVRADLRTGLAVRNGVVTSMTELAGKTVTVTGLCNGDVKVDGRPQYWSKEMFTAVIKQEKPKFAVGDIVTTDGVLGTADWDIARRVTAVNMETRKYEMEWADGVVAEINSPISFTEADAFLTQYTGKVPTAEQSHITAEQFAAIKVGDKLKLRTDLKVGKGYGSMKWLPEKDDLATRGITPVITYIDDDGTVKAAAECDFWWYTAEMIAEVVSSEPGFDCPELVAGQVYVAMPFDAVLAEEWLCRYFPYVREVAGNHVATFGGSVISPSGHFYATGYLPVNKWRKATAEEVAKLEAAEKEHGYVPPLVNEVGTVIEADKYYVLTGSAGTKRICKVYATQHKAGVFYKKPVLVDLEGCHAVSTDMEYTDLGSPYGKSAVPATEEQIALYDAAVAWHEAQKAFREVA